MTEQLRTDEEQYLGDEKEDAQEDLYIDLMGKYLKRVADLHWPNLVNKHLAQVGMALVLSSSFLVLLSARFVPHQILSGAGSALSPILQILADSPLSLVISQGVSGLVFFLIVGVANRQLASAIVFLGHMVALYETEAIEGERRFMERVKRIFRKVEQDRSSFTHALLAENLVVQAGSEKERYGSSSDISSMFIQVTTWGLLIASTLLAHDALLVSTEILAFLWVWVL